MRHEEAERLISKIPVGRAEPPRRTNKGLLLTGAICLLAASAVCAYMAVTNEMTNAATTTYEATYDNQTAATYENHTQSDPALGQEMKKDQVTEDEFTNYVTQQVAGLEDHPDEVSRCAKESWESEANGQTTLSHEVAHQAYLSFRYSCLRHDIPKALFAEYIRNHTDPHTQVEPCVEQAWNSAVGDAATCKIEKAIPMFEQIMQCLGYSTQEDPHHEGETYHEEHHHEDGTAAGTYHEEPHHEEHHHQDGTAAETYHEEPHHEEHYHEDGTAAGTYHEEPHHEEYHHEDGTAAGTYHEEPHYEEHYHEDGTAAEAYHEEPHHEEHHHEDGTAAETYHEEPHHEEHYNQDGTAAGTYHEEPHHDATTGETYHEEPHHDEYYVTEEEFVHHVTNEVAGLENNTAEVERCAKMAWDEQSNGDMKISKEQAHHAYLSFRYACLRHDIPKDLFLAYVRNNTHGMEKAEECALDAWHMVNGEAMVCKIEEAMKAIESVKHCLGFTEDPTYETTEADQHPHPEHEYIKEEEFIHHVTNQVAGFGDEPAEIERCAKDTWQQRANGRTELHREEAHDAYLQFRYECLRHDIPRALFTEFVRNHTHGMEGAEHCANQGWENVVGEAAVCKIEQAVQAFDHVRECLGFNQQSDPTYENDPAHHDQHHHHTDGTYDEQQHYDDPATGAYHEEPYHDETHHQEHYHEDGTAAGAYHEEPHHEEYHYDNTTAPYHHEDGTTAGAYHTEPHYEEHHHEDGTAAGTYHEEPHHDGTASGAYHEEGHYEETTAPHHDDTAAGTYGNEQQYHHHEDGTTAGGP